MVALPKKPTAALFEKHSAFFGKTYGIIRQAFGFTWKT